jgi:hypothetical protein
LKFDETLKFDDARSGKPVTVKCRVAKKVPVDEVSFVPGDEKVSAKVTLHKSWLQPGKLTGSIQVSVTLRDEEKEALVQGDVVMVSGKLQNDGRDRRAESGATPASFGAVIIKLPYDTFCFFICSGKNVAAGSNLEVSVKEDAPFKMTQAPLQREPQLQPTASLPE